MKQSLSKEIVGKWLTGWALSRQLPLPTPYKSGFKVEVGYEDQKSRYVFTNLNDDYKELALSINDPWIFLKVCATPEEVEKVLPERWIIQPQGYMMNCFHRMKHRSVILERGYNIKSEEYNSTHLLKVFDISGEMAASGRVVLVDDIAIYDRIGQVPIIKEKGLHQL